MTNYKTVRDLSREQLEELKLSYLIEQANENGQSVYWSDLANAQDNPDAVIYARYDGIAFTDADFFCTADEMEG